MFQYLHNELDKPSLLDSESVKKSEFKQDTVYWHVKLSQIIVKNVRMRSN